MSAEVSFVTRNLQPSASRPAHRPDDNFFLLERIKDPPGLVLLEELSWVKFAADRGLGPMNFETSESGNRS